MTDIPAVPPFATAWLQAQQAFLQLARSSLAGEAEPGTADRFVAEQYRQLFAMSALPAGLSITATNAGPARYQTAVERLGRFLNEAAIDAARRLGAALAGDGPGATPITTLRELHALWIECGEAAWSAVAHREEFAAAQAEFLAALAALRGSGQAP